VLIGSLALNSGVFVNVMILHTIHKVTESSNCKCSGIFLILK